MDEKGDRAVRERERIRQAYAERDGQGIAYLYSSSNPAAVFAEERRWLALKAFLHEYGGQILEGRTLLDLGCGRGIMLNRMRSLGFRPGDLYGIDLLPNRIEAARKLAPEINFTLGYAVDLPFEDGFFDFVTQFTAFSSMLDPSVRKAVAAEMLRVLRPEGAIIWYDFHVSKPGNRHVRRVGKKEIAALFPGCRLEFRRVTLAPPLARMIAPLSFRVCRFLENMRFLNTHYLVAISR